MADAKQLALLRQGAASWNRWREDNPHKRIGLSLADLSDAQLSRAYLHGAYLHGANLSFANLYGVRLGATVLGDVNLSQVKGLTDCIHFGPSALDHRTLSRSGQLPTSFLRGVGLPDTFIDYIPSLLNQPIQFYSCFISYSHQDEAFAKRLHADLQDKGGAVLVCPRRLADWRKDSRRHRSSDSQA